MPLSLAVDQLADNSSSEEETEASPSQLKSSKLPTYSDAEELGAACESPTYSDAELGEDVGESPAYSSGEESDCGNALANASDADNIPSTSSPAQSPLYPGAKINAATGALLLHSLTMKHGLTHAALADILQLLRLHLPENSTPAAYGSVHRLLNASSLKSSAEVVHILCRDCGIELVSEVSSSGHGGECLHSHVIEFYELSLDAQILILHAHIMSNQYIHIPGHSQFVSLLQWRFSHIADGCIRDVYDGTAYNQLTSPGGFLSVPTNLTLLMNTDGAQVFRSSSHTLWPVFFVINELPSALRYTIIIHALVLLYLAIHIMCM